MKKVLLILSIFLTGLVLISCGGDEVDSAQDDLDAAYSALSGLIADPSNITGGFEVPTSLVGGVEATWESDQPGVLSFGTSSGGFAPVTVNRPAKGDGDANVTITATLTIPSALDDSKNLTKEWTLDVTVKENTVEDLVIEDVADVLAITDASYDGTYQVELSDLTVFAVSGGNSFAYDGTGSIQIYGESLEVGSVYTVAATIEWYYGIWELTDATATLQEGATPQYPTKETISSVQTFVDGLVANGENLPGEGGVADGNFEVIYAELTGVVYILPGDSGNYNTYIVDQDFDADSDQMPGANDVPADGFLVYYGSSSFTDIRLFDGLEVTMDVVIYTYRSNNDAFAVLYTGGEGGIVPAAATDLEKQQIDADALSIPNFSVDGTTLDLVDTGILGSTIAWSFTDSDDTNNSYVNLETGVATVPETGLVTVGLTATVSMTGLDDITVDFELNLGNPDLSTIAEAKALDSGETVRVQGVLLGYVGNNMIAIQDETGAVAIYSPDLASNFSYMVGEEIELIAVTDYYGLEQLSNVINYNVVDDEAGLPDAMDLQTVALWNEDSLEAYQSMRVSVSNLKITEWSDASYGNIEMTLLDETTGQTLEFKWDSRVDLDNLDFLKATKVGDYVSFDGAVLGWSNGPLLTVSDGEQISAGTQPVLTDEMKANLDANAIDITTTFNGAGTLELPVTGVNGSTITWSFADAENLNNVLIDLSSGAVSEPNEGSALIVLTAMVASGSEVKMVDFTVEVIKSVNAPKVFISEYIEGSSNYKAIEIYNGTGAVVDLSMFSIELYSNDDVVATESYTLSGNLNAGDVFVIVRNDGNPGATLDALLAAADVSFAYNDEGNVVNHNGNDTIALLYNGTIIDLFGVISTDETNFAKDVTLVRKSSVTGPNATYTESEWDQYAKDTTEYLGSHTVDAE